MTPARVPSLPMNSPESLSLPDAAPVAPRNQRRLRRGIAATLALGAVFAVAACTPAPRPSDQIEVPPEAISTSSTPSGGTPTASASPTTASNTASPTPSVSPSASPSAAPTTPATQPTRTTSASPAPSSSDVGPSAATKPLSQGDKDKIIAFMAVPKQGPKAYVSQSKTFVAEARRQLKSGSPSTRDQYAGQICFEGIVRLKRAVSVPSATPAAQAKQLRAGYAGWEAFGTGCDAWVSSGADSDKHAKRLLTGAVTAYDSFIPAIRTLDQLTDAPQG